MKDQNSMTEKESLELITSMINRAKNSFGENGFLYLVWGWAILIFCLIQFVSQVIFGYEKGYYVWILTWVIAIYNVFYIKKKKKKRNVRTYTDEINSSIWISFLISIFILMFICIQFKHPGMIYPVLLVMYGIPIFLSGKLMKFTPLVLGGIFCWLLGIAGPFVPVEYGVLLIALALIGAWIIPGYLLRSRHHQELRAEGKSS